MSFRPIGLCALLFLTSGCSSLPSLHSLLAFDGDETETAQAAPAAPIIVPAAPAGDEWCRRIAASSRAQAVASGFDAATQERMAQQSYQQCMAMPQG